MGNIQMIDVRDAAEWVITCAEEKHLGAYNLGRRYKWEEFLGACRALSSAPCRSHWLHFTQMQQLAVKEYTEMVGFIPRQSGPGFYNIEDEKAMKAGMRYRSLNTTLQDVVAGFNDQYPKDFVFGEKDCNCGITPQREAEILAKMQV